MARKRLLASGAVSTRKADDFRRIKGIGPAIEKRLHSAGIRTFERLAALSADEVATLIPGLSAERIAKQGWLRQARKLAPKPAPATPRTQAAAPVGRQHYATFTVELLLDENEEARRTRVAHIQSGDMDTWAGWEAERLIDFLARHTASRSRLAKPAPLAVAPKPVRQAVPASEPGQPADIAAESGPQIPPAVGLAPPAVAVSEPVPRITAAEPTLEVTAATKSASLPTTTPGLAGVLRLRGLEAIPTNMNTPQSTLPHGQAFEVRFSLDLTNVTMSGNPPLDYAASVYARNLGNSSRQMVGEAQGTITLANSITLIVGGADLPRGLYRLEVVVILSLTSAPPSPAPGLQAWLEGSLLQIY